MELPEIMIYGFIAIFVVSLTSIVGVLLMGEYVHPIMGDVANETVPNSSPIDVQDHLDFGISIFYIVIGIAIAIPVLYIIVKFFYEKEHYTA